MPWTPHLSKLIVGSAASFALSIRTAAISADALPANKAKLFLNDLHLKLLTAPRNFCRKAKSSPP